MSNYGPKIPVAKFDKDSCYLPEPRSELITNDLLQEKL